MIEAEDFPTIEGPCNKRVRTSETLGAGRMTAELGDWLDFEASVDIAFALLIGGDDALNRSIARARLPVQIFSQGL